jgi:hypothetical protein
MSNRLAIFYFLKSEFLKDKDVWFSVRDVSCALNLSIDRTRKHLSVLSIRGDVVTRIDGWRNIYRFKD